MYLGKKQKAGFTLAELLAVVIILGLLSALSLGAYKKSVEQSLFAEGLSLASTVVEAVERFHVDETSAGNDPTGYYGNLWALDIGIAGANVSGSRLITRDGKFFIQINPDTGVVHAYRGPSASVYQYYIEMYPHFTASSARDRIACVGKKNGETNESSRTFCEAQGYTQCATDLAKTCSACANPICIKP